MEYEAIEGSCQWADAERTMINMTIVVNSAEVPFTATMSDPEAVGRSMFLKAVHGGLGKIADYIEPVPVEAPKPSVEDLMAQLAAIQAQLSQLQKET
ncbi:hypothetical protein [Pseudomonas oryzihabitans]|uniref:hypothetical protein n=1 Tax=Pseudomonas oryzihabitans TaxID=47885 RepID=UPI0015E28475|nr:hypothetical protein [Pseudomonas psychrotolerans]MBA1211526.1 hypothetical protein [Pseudomonas psychrotolerans]